MKLKILIVEDDPMVAQIHKHYLEQLKNFDILNTIENGNEAYRYIREHDADIDLVILDVNIPGMSGLEVLKALREEGSNVSVIPITAMNDNKTISEFLNLGIVDYLVKPFSQERFNNAVYRCELKFKTFNKKENLQQTDIDKMIHTNSQQELPKGLQKETLNYIVSALKTYKKQLLDVEEISKITNLSKVSLRKYLDYLTDQNEIEKRIDYGTVGRPKYKYYIK
ncbi:MAG: response regulator [Candidatus Izimaplasma sp.]|nr:response regulator [Candidatus Izimaplasma bacterium]